MGFLCSLAGKESAYSVRGPGFHPWVGKIPWRRERLSTPVFWPGEFHGLYSPWDCKESDKTEWLLLSVQFSSVAQSCPTLCGPMSIPGLPVSHQLPEFTQTHIHRVSDTIQASHPLSSPFSSCPQSLPASEPFPMSQLFAWGGQSIGVSASASVLSMNTQNWSPLGWTGWISLQSKGLSRVFSNTTIQKHLSSQSNSHIHTWHWKNHSLD